MNQLKTVKKVKKTVVEQKLTYEAQTITELGAIIRMASETELPVILSRFSVEQINLLVDHLAEADSKINKLKAEIKEIEQATKYLQSPLLETLKIKKQKNVVTPEGNVAEVAAGRATSTFTTTISEFIDIAKDAGCGNNIDNMLTISKTKAEEYLGKALVNKITVTSKEEFGGLKFSRITK